MADTNLYAFNRADSLALLASIGAAGASGGITDPTMQTADIMIGITTSAITARAGSTLGTGTVSAKKIDSSRVMTNAYASDHTVLNPGTIIPVNKYVLMFRVGDRYAVVELC
jgi:hypothetical protein